MATTTTRTEVTTATGANGPVSVGDRWSVDTPFWVFSGTVTAMEVVETTVRPDDSFGVVSGTSVSFRSVNVTVTDEDGETTVVDAATRGQGRFAAA